jgi:NADH-quinone oxidoreductase subunit M
MIFPLILFLIPLAGSLMLFAINKIAAARKMALIMALLEFVVGVLGFVAYRNGSFAACCVGQGGALLGSLHLSMDGISLLPVILTVFLTPLIIVISFSQAHERPGLFYGLILLMEMAFIGVFTTTNGLAFYIFWELALIPAWLICAMWGGKDRIRITFKFFIYTFTGSLSMLGALLYVYSATPGVHSFEFSALYQASLTATQQTWIFWALFFAFAVKIPIFPFHSWQPDTYTESPLAGTLLLAGIMLKMGTYGLIRVLLPIAPLALVNSGTIALWVSIAGIVYASVIAIMQKDMKRLIAYASIAHVGLIAAAIFSSTFYGLQGALLQMLAHGINVTALFFMIDLYERRTGSRTMGTHSGIARKAPWFAAFFLIFILATIALPLTNGFVGEFMMMMGIFQVQPWMAAVAGLGIIFGAVYMLWMYQRTILGPGSDEPFADLNRTEILISLILLITVMWMGIYPNTFLKVSESGINLLVAQLHSIN